jgi:hypothetical protein
MTSYFGRGRDREGGYVFVYPATNISINGEKFTEADLYTPKKAHLEPAPDTSPYQPRGWHYRYHTWSDIPQNSISMCSQSLSSPKGNQLVTS